MDDTTTCPECHEQFARRGMGAHRRLAHGIVGRKPTNELLSALGDLGRRVAAQDREIHAIKARLEDLEALAEGRRTSR